MTLYDVVAEPDLTAPVLVCALEGWIDAGLGGTAAMAAVLETRETQVVASFDDDVLLDHRARRPVLRIVDGVHSGLTWPATQLLATQDDSGRDLLLLVGPEPDNQWRRFATGVAELAQRFGTTMLVGLGAFPAPVPHSRPVRLAATASSADLAETVGFVPGAIEVPSGVQAVLEQQFAADGVPAVGLWARVPHYAAAMPYPAASLALVEGLGRLAQLDLPVDALEEAAEQARIRIDALIANSDEHVAMVRELEAQHDAEVARGKDLAAGLADLPTGEEIAAELERFLRGEPGAP